MSSCFGKYGIDNLTNFDFTSSDYINTKKNSEIYCSIRKKLNSGNYNDSNFVVKNGVLTYVKSNEKHLGLVKAQYDYYYTNDISLGFDLFTYEIPNDCYDISESNIDISNGFTGSVMPTGGAIDAYAEIMDGSFNFTDIDASLKLKLPRLEFPVKVHFDNKFC